MRRPSERISLTASPVRFDLGRYRDHEGRAIRIGADPEKPALRALFMAEQSVGYWDREF
jgi:hypothetical protein